MPASSASSAIIALAGVAAIAQTSTPPAPQLISANGTQICTSRRALARLSYSCTARWSIPATGSRNGRRLPSSTDSSVQPAVPRGRWLA